MNLLFAINRGYISVFLNCLKSVALRGGAASYDAYILHSDLTADDQEEISRQTGRLVTCHFVYVDPSLFDGFPESKRYPKQIYYRIAAPLLLPETLDRILYLDGDIVVINSLTALYERDFEGAYYLACSHTRRLLTQINRVRLGAEEAVPYINTGVMLMDLPVLREKLDMEQICAYAAQKKNALLLPDQDIISALYGEHIGLLDSMVYNISDRILNFYNADPKHARRDVEWVRQNSVIIHYCGRAKPWNDHYSGVLDVFYHELKETKLPD